jgi:uncharacterized protein YndB with AHSA1/START domain
MGITTRATTRALEVRRTFQASRQRVFDAWTRAEEVKKWAAPGPLTVPLAEIELRVGGRYRYQMVGPDGSEHRVAGVYREVDPPRKLVYTWAWENVPDGEETTVTVEFHDLGTTTEVVLRHEGFSSEQKRLSHEHGWSGCLQKLDELFAGS